MFWVQAGRFGCSFAANQSDLAISGSTTKVLPFQRTIRPADFNPIIVSHVQSDVYPRVVAGKKTAGWIENSMESPVAGDNDQLGSVSIPAVFREQEFDPQPVSRLGDIVAIESCPSSGRCDQQVEVSIVVDVTIDQASA